MIFHWCKGSIHRRNFPSFPYLRTHSHVVERIPVGWRSHHNSQLCSLLSELTLHTSPNRNFGIAFFTTQNLLLKATSFLFFFYFLNTSFSLPAQNLSIEITLTFNKRYKTAKDVYFLSQLNFTFGINQMLA